MHSRSLESGTARARDGRGRRATAWCVLGAFLGSLPGSPALAELEGERVVEGQASFERDGTHTTITTGTRETIVDYDRFDIGVEEQVRIDQPDARSRILNRVPYGDASRIDGGLSSNGIVYILNPSGVFLGERAIVDVGGLVAGAGSLSNDDFLAGVDRFSEVEGDVRVAAGATLRSAGDVVLVGRRVENLGSILAQAGMVAIVAGENVVLAPMDGHVAVRVDGPGSPPAEETGFALTQAGSVEAQRVTLSAGDTYSLAMNHTGVTRAEEIHVETRGDGLVQVAGELDASSSESAGGKIQVLAGKIALLDAKLDASGAAGGGEILVGGDVRGGGGLPTARRLYVGPEAELRADATQQGDGGKIVLFARERTAFQGTLSARGGSQGGDGGFAEISGAQLESRGQIALGAPAGEAGTLLYDPDVIQIQGGLADGTDTPDASDTTVYGNRLGEVLSGDVGTGAVPFVVYESEIEGSDANIILEAVNRIFASGNFDYNANGEGVGVVALVPGNSLTLRTTGTQAGDLTSSDLGIDLVTQAVQGEALTWRVREGGRISLETNLATLETPPADAPKASIEVGVLEAVGLPYVEAPEDPDDPDAEELMTPDVTEIIDGTDAISVTTERGDIQVARLEADGEDSVAPAPGQLGRTASPGRLISVTTQQGDVAVDAVSAVGGSATLAQPTRGEVGGVVTLDAVGNVTIGAGGVDVSGGNGLDGVQVLGTPFVGGGGGGIILSSAEGQGVLLLVQGNLTARGGDAVGSFTPPVEEGEDPVTIEADGGLGGAVALTSESDLTLTTDPDDPMAAPVVIDVSGGDGTGSGGNAVTGGTTSAISIIGGPQNNTPGDVRVNATLRANGGDARQGGTSTAVGGAGGSGGNVTVIANGGKLLAAEMEIEANGGAGEVGVDAEGKPLVDDQGRLVGAGGGSTGSISLGGIGETAIGRIEARGGDAINGGAGQGASIGIGSSESSVTLAGDIDVSGGDANLAGATGVAVGGGRGGSVRVSASGAPEDAEDEAANVGDVFLAGVVGGRGGAGVDLDEMGDAVVATRAQGVSIDVEADGDLELGPDAVAGDRFEGGSVDLQARNIGAGGAVGIAGTGEDTDSAELVASGTLRADLDPAVERSLTRVDVQMTDAAGHAELTRGGVVIASSSATSGTTPHTLLQLGRDDDGDPLLGYRLNVTLEGDDPQPELLIAENAVRLGTAGGEIANGGVGTTAVPLADNRGAILGAAGAERHATTRGTLSLEGSTFGTSSTPLLFDGAQQGADVDADGDLDGGAALRLDAAGDVHVGVLDVDSASFAAIDVVQRSIEGDVTMDLRGSDAVSIVAEGTPQAPISRLALADTTASGTAFAYKVDVPEVDTQLQVDRVRLGGTGLLSTTGDLVLTDAAGTEPVITTGGHDLTLVSRRGSIVQESADAVALDFGGAGGVGDEDPARLAFRAGTAAGSATAPLRTRGLRGVAGTAFDGGVYLVNADAGPGAEDLRIERVVNLDPPDLEETLTGSVSEVGVRALNGNLQITHLDPEGRIVLGSLRSLAEFADAHADATGDVALNGRIEIENARFFRTLVPRLDEEGNQEEDEDGNPIFDTVFLRLNDARIRSTRGNVVLNGSVNTSADSTATSEDDAAPADEFVHASLLAQAVGTVRFTGDVGRRDDDAAPLALIDTTAAVVAGERSFEVGDALFRGTLDAPGGTETGGATIVARDLPSSEADHQAIVLIDGDVGGAQALTQLSIEAERIAFTSTDRVVTGDGGIRMTTNQTAVPQVATISDSIGGVRFATSGDFSTAYLDKLSVAGPLEIAAASAQFTDLSATSIVVDSPNIVIATRQPGPVQQPGDAPDTNGNVVASGADGGTDIVADEIRLSSVPTTLDPDPTTTDAAPRFGLGSGGISAPGRLSAFQVTRFTPGVDGVDRELFFGQDGRILDLTPVGGPVIGNPSSDLPRERPETLPSLPPRESGESPAPPPAVDAEQLLAFLRCGAPGAPTSCDAQAMAPLAGLTDFEDSTLASERAADLAARYQALRSRDLSAAFDAAGAGFRAQSGFGEFDAEAFGGYLEASREHEGARTAVHELATLLVEIDLLGVAPGVEAQLRRTLASDLAHEADLPGFDADAVLVAVAATPIGLPPQ